MNIEFDLLFFRVFRNKIIFKNIFSNFKKGHGFSTISLHDLFRKYEIGYLKDKIKAHKIYKSKLDSITEENWVDSYLEYELDFPHSLITSLIQFVANRYNPTNDEVEKRERVEILKYWYSQFKREIDYYLDQYLFKDIHLLEYAVSLDLDLVIELIFNRYNIIDLYNKMDFINAMLCSTIEVLRYVLEEAPRDAGYDRLSSAILNRFMQTKIKVTSSTTFNYLCNQIKNNDYPRNLFPDDISTLIKYGDLERLKSVEELLGKNEFGLIVQSLPWSSNFIISKKNIKVLQYLVDNNYDLKLKTWNLNTLYLRYHKNFELIKELQSKYPNITFPLPNTNSLNFTFCEKYTLEDIKLLDKFGDEHNIKPIDTGTILTGAIYKSNTHSEIIKYLISNEHHYKEIKKHSKDVVNANYEVLEALVICQPPLKLHLGIYSNFFLQNDIKCWDLICKIKKDENHPHYKSFTVNADVIKEMLKKGFVESVEFLQQNYPDFPTLNLRALEIFAQYKNEKALLYLLKTLPDGLNLTALDDPTFLFHDIIRHNQLKVMSLLQKKFLKNQKLFSPTSISIPKELVSHMTVEMYELCVHLNDPVLTQKLKKLLEAAILGNNLQLVVYFYSKYSKSILHKRFQYEFLPHDTAQKLFKFSYFKMFHLVTKLNPNEIFWFIPMLYRTIVSSINSQSSVFSFEVFFFNYVTCHKTPLEMTRLFNHLLRRSIEKDIHGFIHCFHKINFQPVKSELQALPIKRTKGFLIQLNRSSFYLYEYLLKSGVITDGFELETK
ncbi:SAP DNA-binding domain-containing protein [Tieghemostelium lacteum]|uniref:SAP DNA-binding domain-containing protein n=1 Tax=Tieghemostelium lacteum TaxID=361077 RepID=A0A152A081_TIELA|nr:SAP DNA-binding domain-containing protein [Tieghemostelium lacteum]|eukprot:KYQ99662.1 SAP DNA-binding domain-containing protein [Tieghemostelium lacteum]